MGAEEMSNDLINAFMAECVADCVEGAYYCKRGHRYLPSDGSCPNCADLVNSVAVNKLPKVFAEFWDVWVGFARAASLLGAAAETLTIDGKYREALQCIEEHRTRCERQAEAAGCLAELLKEMSE